MSMEAKRLKYERLEAVEAGTVVELSCAVSYLGLFANVAPPVRF